jgi:Zn-dependent protease/CBS domain-containing protein
VAGIELRIHFLFPLLLIWVGLSEQLAGRGAGSSLRAVFFVVLLFGVVVLHELGHALAARRYGIATRDITLLPIGGVARLERIPEKPSQELMIALAGPMVNVLLAALFALVAWASGEPLSLVGAATRDQSIIVNLLAANLLLATFNMIPAFPMDGGRVFRAFLAMRLPYSTATDLAAGVGQGFAVLMGLFGLFFNPFLLLLAVFVWVGAASEAMSVRMRLSLAGVTVRDVMVSSFVTLDVSDSVQRAVSALMEGFQGDFPVLEGGRMVGTLGRADIVRALSEGRPDAPVVDYMSRTSGWASPDERLVDVLPRIESCACRMLPVVLQDGRLVGLITPDNLSDHFALSAALSRGGSARNPGL